MVEHDRIYVYTGSESGYTSGHWYYWNGSDWIDGGVYNSTAIQTDTTLAISGMAADAKSTGDSIASIKSDLSDFNCVNFLHRGENKTLNGITWTWHDDGSCTVSGTNTSSASALNYLLGSSNTPVMPQGMTPGKTYNVSYNSKNVMLRIIAYNGATSLGNTDFKTSNKYTVPANATGLVAVLRMASGTVVGTETVKPIMYSADTNEELTTNTIKNNAPKYRISRNSDLNTFVTPGQYFVQTVTDAENILNIPIIKAGQLMVCVISQYSDTVKTICQIYIAVGLPSVFIRYISDISGVTTYSNWREMADTDDIDSAITNANLATLCPIEKPALASGDDLNTYLTAGQWRIPTTAIARRLKNKPSGLNTTGTLIILNTHNTNHVYQIILTNGTTNIWARHIMIDEERFDEWKSLTTVENNGYLWMSPGFILHSPQEETVDMQDVFADYLEKTITNTHYWATRTDGFRDVPSSDIYALWDALQSEYSAYIDEGETIGYSLDTDGTNYAPVKAYYIHPRMTDGANRPISYNDMPTVYITAGTHGVEGSPTWNLFAIFRRAFLTGTIYSAFLSGIKFRIVPCLSRWSYDHYKRYLAAAYNADGTQKVSDEDLPLYDANRMCICEDDTNPSYATLTIPSYAGEAKALTDYMQMNGFGAGDVYLDLHNCSYSLGYMTSDNLPIRYAFNTVMDTLAKDWLANATYANGDPVDYYNTSTNDHFALHGKILGKESVENSFAWFFEKAYNPFSSNILEVQALDDDSNGTTTSSCNEFALAKGLDITYRWLKYICDHIRD